jgi:hypothetical protein
MNSLTNIYKNNIQDHTEYDDDDVPMNYDDYEGRIAKQHLYKLHKYSGELFEMLHDYQEIELWAQEKIATAVDYIDSVKNYLEYEMQYPGEENAFEDVKVPCNNTMQQEQVHCIDDILPDIKRSIKENTSFKFKTRDDYEIIVNSRISKNIYETYLKLNDYNKEKYSNNLVQSKISFWKVASFATA